MEKLKIGLPCSPSKRISVETIKATEILVSYGGGLGGTSKTYYFTEKNSDTYTLVNGEVIRLNSNFIVMEKPIVLVKQITDTTNHSNYRSTKYKKTILTEYYKLKYEQDFEILDKYNSESRNKVILTDLYTEHI
jgi:hypothetical protein